MRKEDYDKLLNLHYVIDAIFVCYLIKICWCK